MFNRYFIIQSLYDFDIGISRQLENYLAQTMVADTVKWFCQVMGHHGENRLGESLRQHYCHPTLCEYIEKLKCQDGQKYKIPGHV